MNFRIQQIIENKNTILYPLEEKDFEELYLLASEPKVWEQHLQEIDDSVAPDN